jgi:hypothetical protein
MNEAEKRRDWLFADMGAALGELTEEKNEAYGDSFARSGEIMSILYPYGITPNQYRDALGVVRVLDKLFRIATRKDAFGESPWKDIAGYGIVGAVTDELTRLPPPSPLPSFLSKEPIPFQVVTDADAEPTSKTEACPPTKGPKPKYVVEMRGLRESFWDLESATERFEYFQSHAHPDDLLTLFKGDQLLLSFGGSGAQ